MKKFKLLALLIPAFLIIGCGSDDDKSGNSNPQLTGTWNLVNANGGFTGNSVDFEDGAITWTFKDNGTSVAIVNNHTPEDGEVSTMPTGNYTVAFEANEAAPDLCANTIIINNSDHGCLSVNGSNMIMSQAFADGIELKFVKE